MAPSKPNRLGPLGGLISERSIRFYMCDCYDYELEEQAVELEAKEPEKVAMPIRVVCTKSN